MKIPWNIPNHWQWRSMGEVSEIIGGGTPNTERADYFGGDIPWITPADLSGYTNKFIGNGKRFITKKGLENSGAKLMPKGSVLFSSRAPIGYVAIAENAVATNQGFKSFVINKELTSDFVYYWMQVAKKFAVELASGTTFLEISGKSTAQLPIPVPPIEEQISIVKEIEKQVTRIEAGVTALKRMQANLKRYRAAVLEAGCEGRLVDTEAEVSRREGRGYETGEELLKRILYESKKKWEGRGKYKVPSLAESPKPTNLPEGWTWVSPVQLASSDRYSFSIGPFGSNLKVSDYRDSGVPLIFVKNIRTSRFGDSIVKFVTKPKAEELKAHQVSGGDILITKMGLPPGDACLYPEMAANAVITADCIKFRLSPILRYKSFFVHAINSEVVKPQIQNITKGVAQLKVSLERFGGIGLPFPPLNEQKRIVEEVERRVGVIVSMEKAVEENLERAEGLRRAVLQKAFTEKKGNVHDFEIVYSENGRPGPDFVRYFEEQIAAGDFDLPQIGHTENRWIRVKGQQILTEDMFVGDVVGDSMEPEVPKNSKILLKDCSVPDETGMYVFQQRQDGDSDEGGRYNLKRCRRAGNKILLVPNNPNHSSREYGENSELRCVAKFIQVVK